MELLTKNFKLVGGVLVIICCLLPFITVGIGGLGSVSANGFSLFNGTTTGLLSILLILAGAAALIYVDVTKKDITLAPKFTLSFVAKLAALAGGVIILIYILTNSFVGVGFGLILEIIVALALLFEEKIVAAMKK
jgi:hypothetical protein